MPQYDIAVIGAGLLGCFAARNLSRFNWKVAVFEKNLDVCAEMSKANTAIIYPGYDASPGSLKARLNIAAMRGFEALCDELGVRFARPGSMMAAFGPRGERVIEEKYRQGLQNGVDGLELICASEALFREPNLRPDVKGALYAKSTATLNPWELGIAAAENAAANGVRLHMGTQVTNIEKTEGGYLITASGKTYTSTAVVNCAGLFADEVSEMINRPQFHLNTTTADYLVLDKRAHSFVRHIIMHEPEEKGRGATLVPTVDGNLLLGPSKEKSGSKALYDTTEKGCRFVGETCKYVFPEMPLDLVIRRFAGIRPGIAILDSKGLDTGERMNDLFIREAGYPTFINVAGIKTPGLTCCNEIGAYITEMLLDTLGNPGMNHDYNPRREAAVRFSQLDFHNQCAHTASDATFGRVVCRCEKITEGEILAAIRRMPIPTVDGVKRRTGAQMGRCQGGFCTQRILELISREREIPVHEVLKSELNSEILYGKL